MTPPSFLPRYDAMDTKIVPSPGSTGWMGFASESSVTGFHWWPSKTRGPLMVILSGKSWLLWTNGNEVQQWLTKLGNEQCGRFHKFIDREMKKEPTIADAKVVNNTSTVGMPSLRICYRHSRTKGHAASIPFILINYMLVFDAFTLPLGGMKCNWRRQ